MNKIIEIMDYRGSKQPIEINNFDDVVRITVEVITGDELLMVMYKNYDIKRYDSSYTRTCDFLDDKYCIYDTIKDLDIINKWAKRGNSYDKDWTNKVKDNEPL